jgi:hypothetical protein
MRESRKEISLEGRNALWFLLAVLFPYPRKEFYSQAIWPWSRTVIVGGLQIFLPMLETTPSIAYCELYNTTNRLLDRYRCARYHKLLRIEWRYPCGFVPWSVPWEMIGKCMAALRYPGKG